MVDVLDERSLGIGWNEADVCLKELSGSLDGGNIYTFLVTCVVAVFSSCCDAYSSSALHTARRRVLEPRSLPDCVRHLVRAVVHNNILAVAK